MKVLKAVLMDVNVRLFVISSMLVGSICVVFDWKALLYGVGIYLVWAALIILVEQVEWYELSHKRGPINLEVRMSGKKLREQRQIEKQIVEQIEYSQEELDSIFDGDNSDLPWFEGVEDPTKF